MAKWKKIATVDSDGALNYPTTGAALSVSIDTSLGNGGTGQDLSSAGNSLMYIKDGAMKTLAAPSAGENLILAWTSSSSDPHWQDVTAITHNHEGEYFDTVTTDEQTINGFVSFAGALEVTGTVSFAAVDTAIITSGMIEITTPDTGAPATDFNNKGITLDDGNAGTDNPGIFWSTTAQRWGVGEAGAYQHPLMLCDFTINPTNGATASTDYTDAIGTLAFSSTGDEVFIVTSS